VIVITPKRLVIFLHIPKTGGSTMRGVLDREYGQSHILRVSPDTPTEALHKAGIHCIYGHCRYGLHQHVRQKTTYITFLRDPLDRILSMFYYIRSRPQNKMHDTVKQMSLREFVTTTEPRIQVPLHNHQTRMISGKKQPDLKTAIDHIKKDFAVVGVTDMYPESVFMMRKALGWDDASYKKANVTRKRRKKTDIPPKVKQIVREHNQLDYELYAFAKERLRHQIQNLPPQEQRQLAVFKQKQSR
jgi:hypothetical protein